MRWPTAWNVPIARSNCLRSRRVLRGERSALSATPETTAQVATVVRLSMNARISLPCSADPSRASSPTRTPSRRSSKSGSWFMICWRSQRDAGRVGGDEEERDAAVDARAARRSSSAAACAGHARPSTRRAANRRRHASRWWPASSDSLPYSTSAAVSSMSPRGDLRRAIACCASVPKRAIGQRRTDERRDHRQRRDVAADLAQHHAQVDEAEARARPSDSGNAMPSRFAFANSRQVSRSYQSSERSRSFRCCSVMRSSRIARPGRRAPVVPRKVRSPRCVSWVSAGFRAC